MTFLPISRSRFKQCQIRLFKTITNVLQFSVKFWVIFGHFGKGGSYLKGLVKLRKMKCLRFDGFGKLKFEVKN